VGSELAQSVASKGHEVVIIDKNPTAFLRLGDHFQGRTVQGDVRDRDVLARAGIEEADGFAVVTTSDEINLIAAKVARDTFGVANIAARVYDPVHAEMFALVNLQSIASSSWGAQRIEQLLTHPGLIELESLGHGEVLVIEVLIPEGMAGRSIGDVTGSFTCQPAAIVRAGDAGLAEEESMLEAGDLLVLAIAAADLPKLETAFGWGE
jgi:trk system potassium uptake protein TrkA